MSSRSNDSGMVGNVLAACSLLPLSIKESKDHRSNCRNMVNKVLPSDCIAKSCHLRVNDGGRDGQWFGEIEKPTRIDCSFKEWFAGIYLRFRFAEPIDRPLLSRKVDRPLLLTSEPIVLPDESRNWVRFPLTLDDPEVAPFEERNVVPLFEFVAD